MSLTGNLEDLPLLDILQLVSFSKKTGVLSILTASGQNAIVFQDGFVVCAFTADTPSVDPRARTLPSDKRGRLLRNRIEMSLEQLIRLREGQFAFSLADDVPAAIGPRDISQETLPGGINAQEILLDLARGMDEDRRDSTAALEASFAEPIEAEAGPGAFDEEFALAEASGPLTPPASLPEAAAPAPAAQAEEAPGGEPAAPPTEEAPTILLVDDEEEVRRILAEHFTAGGYQVVEAEEPESAVKTAGRLGKAGIDFRLVTDLGMPTSGGSSFHGGFEVVKRLGKMNMRPPVLLMTDSLNGALQARARQMGISSIVFKPGLSKLDPEQFKADLRAFARKLLGDVLPKMARPAPKAEPPKPGKAVPVASPAPETLTAEELSREFAVLQRHLEELRTSGDASQTATLVMKVAREFFERGVLLLVKNDEARGLGGFGPAPKKESLNLLAREVVIPLSEPSLFLDVVETRKAFSGLPPDGKWSQYLMGKIGRFKSGPVALLPLMTNRETIALLFGDNPDTGRELGRLEALEVFINQAGIALENAFLQRKLHALQGRE